MRNEDPSTRPTQALAQHRRIRRVVVALRGWFTVLFAILLAAAASRAQDTFHPLKPPDRSSPRAMLKTFLASCDTIATHVADEYMSTPTRDGFHQLSELAKVPVECLDLSQYAPASRPKHGAAAALNIYETLSRIDLPPFAEIPGADHPAPAGAPEVQRWTIPNTQITLVRGPTGDFHFSADTVVRSAEFLAKVRAMPYARPMPMENICELPIEGGGWLVPLTWIRSWPAWLRNPLAGQALWKWVALVVILAVLVFILRAAYLVSRRGSPQRPFRQALLQLSLPVFVLAATPVVAYLLLVQVNFVAEVGSAMLLATTISLHLAGAWIIWRIAPVVAEAVIASPQIPTESLDAHLIRIFARLAGIIGAVALLVIGADRLGVPLYGVVAGLGVGGLALALAAQPTIENLIGGLSLFADKPMKVGDYGQYGDVVGTVEGIGIRSTRIRGNDRSLTTVPNATLSKASIVNLAQRDRMLIQTVLGLRYETSPGQLRYVIAKLREMLLAHPQIHPQHVRVRLVGFGESTLDVELFAYATTRSGSEFFGIREDVYLRVMDIVEQAGTSFAFPSQMQYDSRDNGIDVEKARAAEREVARWRAEQQPPSPNAATDRANEARTTLDNPTPGSQRPPAPTPRLAS